MIHLCSVQKFFPFFLLGIEKGENFMYDLTTYDAAQQRYQELLQKMERERLIQTLPPAEGRTVLTQTLWRLGRSWS